MKYSLTVVLLFALGGVLWAQTDAPQGCSKNVSFAVAEGGGQPVPAIPKFTSKWLGGKSRQEGFSKLCFSQVPSLSQANYLVVFSTAASAFEGLKASAHTYKSGGQGDANAPVTSYGGTWSFAYAGAAPPATNTLELKRDDKPKAVAVRAFDQSGRTVSQADLSTVSSRDKLLEKVFSDILKDAIPVDARKSFPAQSPVYYVNCDVEGQPVSPPVEAVPAKASVVTAAAAAPPAPDPPKSELEIWSSPAGADIFLDGAYVGKTPYSQTVSPGEHTVDLRKKNFAIWQRKIQSGPGKRRIGGNLEQKVLELQ